MNEKKRIAAWGKVDAFLTGLTVEEFMEITRLDPKLHFGDFLIAAEITKVMQTELSKAIKSAVKTNPNTKFVGTVKVSNFSEAIKELGLRIENAMQMIPAKVNNLLRKDFLKDLDNRFMRFQTLVKKTIIEALK